MGTNGRSGGGREGKVTSEKKSMDGRERDRDKEKLTKKQNGL